MKTANSPTRRRFFWKAGAAALSAPLGFAAVQASPAEAEDTAALKGRLARIEDLNAIRELNRSFARLVNSGAQAGLASLFSDPTKAPADDRVRRVATDPFDGLDTIEIAADGRTAAARIACAVRIGTPMEGTCSAVDMARQQGGGIAEHAERGAFEVAYIRQEGVWKIAAVSYRGAEVGDSKA